MRFRLSTCIKAGRGGAPNAAKGRAARQWPRAPRAAWAAVAAAAAAGLGSVCWETGAAWAV